MPTRCWKTVRTAPVRVQASPGGSITATTKDDGIHADTYLTITDGTVSILVVLRRLSKPRDIALAGGSIAVSATDDGINAN
ncbi:MAG: carbohydrate-binding domain-containing protein [Sphingobacterium sp.]|nr:carbohydrate-binding domain-containing protein [Sphingobacterium sp.]